MDWERELSDIYIVPLNNEFIYIIGRIIIWIFCDSTTVTRFCFCKWNTKKRSCKGKKVEKEGILETI